MDENTMSHDVIVVRQLPIIEESLRIIKSEVEKDVADVLGLEVNEATLAEVKNKRALLNKSFTEYEEKRKEVKRAILGPYEAFEKIYKECVSDLFKEADAKLKNKIGTVENKLIEDKRSEVESFFNELTASEGLSFISFESAGLKVNLSASITKLKKESEAFIARVKEDYALIITMPDSAEIMAEYVRCFNVAQAAMTVKERHERAEAEKARTTAYVERMANIKKAEDTVAQVAAEAAPVAAVAEAKEDVYALTFTVRGTKEKLRKLKNFLKDGGYDYE